MLRIKPAYLAALEQGRSRDLPGPTYAIGFIRAYADFLGLDGDQMLTRFKAEADGRDGKTRPLAPGAARRAQPAGRGAGAGGADPGVVRLRHLVLPVDRRARPAAAGRRGACRLAAAVGGACACANLARRRHCRELSSKFGTHSGGAAEPAAVRCGCDSGTLRRRLSLPRAALQHRLPLRPPQWRPRLGCRPARRGSPRPRLRRRLRRPLLPRLPVRHRRPRRRRPTRGRVSPG